MSAPQPIPASLSHSSALASLAREFDLSDGDIEDAPDKIAGQVKKLAELWQSAGATSEMVERSMRRIARSHSVPLPGKASIAERLNRMTDPAWWRRSFRKRFRVVEQHEIARGAVHFHASAYVSPKALRRHQRNTRRLAELLASLEVLNLDTGETFPLDDLIATSQANPAMRRMAMMSRIRGVETHAKAKGHEAYFLTITAPSRMHARFEKSGVANPRFDGSSPRQVQTYLNGVWRKAMRSLLRQGVEAYGLRTVEPHHDACPHWHVLVFTPPEHAQALHDTVRTHALADSPDEPGADIRRFTCKLMTSGGAAAYAAKYVAKGIDGHGVADDTESNNDGATAATSVVAWARLWGIRQFQFFGLPAITPTKELYRHDGEGLGSPALGELHEKVKAKDYAGYLDVLEARAIALRVRYRERPSSRYAGEIARAIDGLHAGAADLHAPIEITTRTETWCIQPRPATRDDGAFEFTWTRFNNCARPMKSMAYDGPARTCRGPVPRFAIEGRRRRTPSTGRTAAAAV